MFILYAVLAGVLVGLLSRGSPSRLGRLRFRWGILIALGMLLQVSLFSTPLGQAIGDAAPIVYIGTNLAVLFAVAVNLAIRGLAIVLAGGMSNLVAIVANGGYMPVSEGALAAMGWRPNGDYSNSILRENVNLAPLTDLFAMPTFFPAANVFSVGDVLIGIGTLIAIVTAMHGIGPFVDATGRPDDATPGPSGIGAPAH